MGKLFLASTFMLALVASATQSGGCAVQGASESEDVAALGGGGGGGGPTCDDFDSFCDKDHPCGAGFVCALDTNNCGSNFFGTFPNCGVTATCYPACQPE